MITGSGRPAARAAEFSARMGCEVTAEDVLSADADWLERYGRRIGDVCDDILGDDSGAP
jgi:hypothetical protein